MAEERTSQCRQILDYIDQFGSITPLDAMRDLGVYRLAARISDLKKRGYPIVDQWETVPTRLGKSTEIKRYSLQGGVS